MYRDFPAARIEDVHKSEAAVTVATDGDGKHIARLHAERYSPGVSLWLEPDAARALAAALLEAADEADARQGEDDALEALCQARQEEAPREGDIRISPGGSATIYVNGCWRPTVIRTPHHESYLRNH